MALLPDSPTASPPATLSGAGSAPGPAGPSPARWGCDSDCCARASAERLLFLKADTPSHWPAYAGHARNGPARPNGPVQPSPARGCGATAGTTPRGILPRGTLPREAGPWACSESPGTSTTSGKDVKVRGRSIRPTG